MSINEIAQFTAILKANGYQVTKTREAIFRLLVNNEPQSIPEILIKAKGIVDRVSVYRNIDIFEKIGLVHRVYIGWKYKIELSDEFTGHHHHLSCLECGAIIDIQDEAHIDAFISEVAGRVGFVPRRHQFEVDGLCKDCARKTTSKTGR